MSIESRLQALERRAAQTLPVYLVTFESGSSARLDALGLLLHLAALEAGRKDTEAITDTRYISGTFPAGIAWDNLRENIREMNAGNGTATPGEIQSDPECKSTSKP